MKNNTRFIKYVKEQCDLHGIKYDLQTHKYLDLSGGIKCGGYFDEVNKVLAVAMGHKDSMSLFVHEYCHVTQWIEGIEIWNKCSNEYSHDKMDRWLNGEYIEDINHHIDNCKYLELDNEKRAVKLIKKFDLEIDVDDYIRKSNAYIQFYNYLKLSRKWSMPKNSPYMNERIKANCPKTFSMDYSKISKKLEKIFREENIGFPKSKK